MASETLTKAFLVPATACKTTMVSPTCRENTHKVPPPCSLTPPLCFPGVVIKSHLVPSDRDEVRSREWGRVQRAAEPAARLCFRPRHAARRSQAPVCRPWGREPRFVNPSPSPPHIPSLRGPPNNVLVRPLALCSHTLDVGSSHQRGPDGFQAPPPRDMGDDYGMQFTGRIIAHA